MRTFKSLLAGFALTALAFGPSAYAQEGAKHLSEERTNAIDKSADPCVDFYQFACGNWVKNNPIPADKAIWSSFGELAERNLGVLHNILEEVSKKTSRSAIEQKVGDYYAACMNEDLIEKKGTAALKPEFDRINALKDKSGLPALVAHMHGEAIFALFSATSGADAKHAKEVIAQMDQGGLSLPERGYYFKDDAKSVELRNAFVEHVTKMFTLLGDAPEKAAAEAKAVLAVETALAKGALDPVQRRDPEKIYHKMTVQELQALTPSFSATKYFSALGAPRFTSLNVREPEFFKGLDAELKSVALDDLKTYFRWQVVRSQSQYLPKAIQQESFNFFGKTLSGAKELPVRWKRCVGSTDGDLGDALGQLYVEKYYPPEAKAATLRMVKAIEAALRQDVTDLPWMTETTKKQALVKLDAVQNKIGYPSKWRDYSTVKITNDDALGDALRANAFEIRRQMNKIGKPLNKEEWEITPPTVNAYYNQFENDINFPAGILQPPFYDFKSDDALNFGGMGGVIGHELTHGFDDEGRQFDADGNMRDWWTAEDTKAFKERAKCIVDEYSGFIATDDVHVKGELTLGENTADNGGLRLAHMALLASMAGKQPENIAGYTPEQRLFIGWGQIWCQNRTPEISRMLAQVDPHSPDNFRVDGVVRNMPEFQKAWGCKQGQPMVPANACRVW